MDHEQRRAQIADAAWRVVRRDGYAALSVRTVAAEAGWSVGAIRHYFDSQAALVRFAMHSLAEQVGRRVRARAEVAADLDDIVATLEETLPMDAARRAEAEVWLALTTASRTDPEMLEVWQGVHSGLGELMRRCVRRAAELHGRTIDLTAEAGRLHALTDGLAVHGVLDPSVTPAAIRRAIRDQLLAVGSVGAAASREA